MEILNSVKRYCCALQAAACKTAYCCAVPLRRGLACQFFMALLMMGYFTTVSATTPLHSEAKQALKSEEVARIVLGILSYTKWQPARNPVQLCVVAPTQYSAVLESAVLPEKTLKIVTLRQEYDINRLNTQCDVIYFGEISPQQQQKVSGSKAHPVLTISEANPDCELGSMFCLDTTASPVTFKVNLDSLARSGIHVNPNVLLLGRKKKVAP